MRPMTKLPQRYLLTLACAASVVSCQATPLAMSRAPEIPGATGAMTATTAQSGVLLTGRVEVPGLRRLLATSTDVATVSTVTLLSDGVPVSSGVTDADGLFTLYKSTTPFTPVVGDLFTLEVTRRHTDAREHAILSLRTIVQFTSNDFTSITGKSIVVSPVTTAIAGLPDYTELSHDMLIDAAPLGIAADIRFPNEGEEPGPIAASARMIRSVASTITTRLRANLDPNALHPTTNRDNDVELVVREYADLEPAQKLFDRLRYVDEIKGDLYIDISEEMPSSVFDETALAHLVSVKGNVHIRSTGNGGALKWLGALKHIGGDLIISDPRLANLTGLEALDTVGGDLVLSPFDKKRDVKEAYTLSAKRIENGLADLTALRNLRYVGGELAIHGARDLTSLGDEDAPAFDSLEHLGGLRLEDTGLTSLAGFADVGIGPNNDPITPEPDPMPTIGGFGLKMLDTRSKKASIVLEGNWALTDVSGLANVAGPLGHLIITGSPLITDLSAFDGVTEVDSLGLIDFNNEGTGLTSLAGLQGLTSARDVVISACDDLADVSALGGLTAVRDITFSNLPSLTSLSGLNLASIRDLRLSNLETLASIEALGGVTTARDITFENLPDLTSLTGLGGLTQLGLNESAGGELSIAYAGLTSLEGLGNLGGGGTPVKRIALTALADLESLAGLGATQVNHLELTALPPGVSAGLSALVNHLSVSWSEGYSGEVSNTPTSLAALNGVTVKKSLTLDGLKDLSSFRVDGQGPTLSVLDALTIRGCGITDLTGSGLVHIKEALVLENDNALAADALNAFTTAIPGALNANGKLRLGTAANGYSVAVTGLDIACPDDVTAFINLLDKKGSDNGTTNDGNGVDEFGNTRGECAALEVVLP